MQLQTVVAHKGTAGSGRCEIDCMGSFDRNNASEWHIRDGRGGLRVKEENEGRNDS